jgi:hypothetical protein
MPLIKIYIDVAQAYDALSVLEIKKFQSKEISIKNKLIEQIKELRQSINIALRYDLAKRIYDSIEYKNLYKVNYDLFKLIDDCKKIDIDAKEIDILNHKRFEAKQQLQNKFFGKELEEIKLGYE